MLWDTYEDEAPSPDQNHELTFFVQEEDGSFSTMKSKRNALMKFFNL